jgi:hypothetical protein
VFAGKDKSLPWSGRAPDEDKKFYNIGTWFQISKLFFEEIDFLHSFRHVVQVLDFAEVVGVASSVPLLSKL